MSTIQRALFATALSIVAIGLSACGSSSSTTASGTGTKAHPAATEESAPSSAADSTSAATGDIPDNQVFLTFHDTKAGYSIEYPEGWTQKGNGKDVTFSNKGNTIQVAIAQGPPATLASVKAGLAQLQKTVPSLKAEAPAMVQLKNGAAIKASYTLQSAPDPVTGKRQPLIVDRYVYSHGGKVAIVDLGTVEGVDNVDAYRLISNSFSWQ